MRKLLFLLLLPGFVLADSVTVTRNTPYEWACADASFNILSQHTRQDKAIEACVNRSLQDGEQYQIIPGSYRVQASIDAEPTPDPTPDPEPDPEPTPDPPTASGVGFTSVTVALDATGTGTRYDVTPDKELTDVPWQSLKPGDVVNIYYRAEPYRHKILLSERGTQANPIVINGVTDANGQRPTISGSGATSINPSEWDTDYRNSIILINKQRRSGTYGVNAQHYRIQNIRIEGARAGNSFTHNGTTEGYGGYARGIWSAGGQEIVLDGMIIENNGSGVFVQAAEDPGALSKHWTIRGSKFENNGNGDRDHQIYFQAVSDPGRYNIFEGNYVGPATSTCVCAQLKTRSTGVIIRYNYMEAAPRLLDVVEAQDAIPGWMYQNYNAQQIVDYYRTTHVYGNVFNNNAAAGRPFHFGADSIDGSTWGGSGGPPNESAMRELTYFYHNTYTARHTGWRGNLFDTESNNTNGPTAIPGTVEAWNNVIEYSGNSRIGVMNRSGTTIFRGANVLKTDTLTIFAESDAYANYENPGDDPDVNVIYDGEIVTNKVGAAVPLPDYLHPVLYQPNGKLGGVLPRSLNDLGATE